MDIIIIIFVITNSHLRLCVLNHLGVMYSTPLRGIKNRNRKIKSIPGSILSALDDLMMPDVGGVCDHSVLFFFLWIIRFDVAFDTFARKIVFW